MLTTMMFKAPLLAVIPVVAINNSLFDSAAAFAPPPPPLRAVVLPASHYSSQLSAETLSSEARQPVASEEEGESTATATGGSTNVNFEDWIADAPREITQWTACPVEGTIPPYVRGTLIRNGGGIWSSPSPEEDSCGGGGEMYSHVFDGLAKIHAYRIRGPSQAVEHQARFLKGKWYDRYVKSDRKKLPAGIGTGPVLDSNHEPKTGLWQTLRATIASATAFDNTPVNIWDWTPTVRDPTKKRVTALTDAPPRTTIDFDTMETLSSSTANPLASGARGYEMFITAHPMYGTAHEPSTATVIESYVDTYNAAVELGLNGPRINLIKETGDGERTVISSFACDDGKVPYMHSFGISMNYATIVLQPLRLDVAAPDRMIELGFLRSMEHVEYTRVVLVELATGDVVLDETIDEKVYFYHSISQAETVDAHGDVAEVSLRLCAYDTPDQMTGKDQFMRLERCRKGREWRNRMHPGGKFCDVVCNTKDNNVEVRWNNEIKQGFELPVTRYSRTFDGELPPSIDPLQWQAHPRYVYAFGAYALGSRDYDDWGLFKFDMHTNSIAAYYQQDSAYLSEPVFVPDPDGSEEDDGVLLSQVYFGRERQTRLLVIDAKSMEVAAEVLTGNRAPMDFHGAWIPTSHDTLPLL